MIHTIPRARRGIATAALAFLMLAGLSGVGTSGQPTFSIVRVEPSSARQAAFLLTSFDETHNHRDGYVELLLWPGDADRLHAAGFDYDRSLPMSGRVTSATVRRLPRGRSLFPARSHRLPGPR